jgi:hypothetical protein
MIIFLAVRRALLNEIRFPVSLLFSPQAFIPSILPSRPGRPCGAMSVRQLRETVEREMEEEMRFRLRLILQRLLVCLRSRGRVSTTPCPAMGS